LGQLLLLNCQLRFTPLGVEILLAALRSLQRHEQAVGQKSGTGGKGSSCLYRTSMGVNSLTGDVVIKLGREQLL
jgi:hypothetical protein